MAARVAPSRNRAPASIAHAMPGTAGWSVRLAHQQACSALTEREEEHAAVLGAARPAARCLWVADGAHDGVGDLL